jgi:ABC-type multidrug transport system fused ATPase/permease subunit
MWTFIIYIILLLFLFPLEHLVIPNVFGKLYEVIKDKKTYTNPYDFIKNLKAMNTPGLLTAVVIVYIISLCAHNTKHYIESFISPSYLKYLRALLFQGTVNKNQEEYKDVKSGEYLATVMELSRNVRDIFQYTISEFLPYFIIALVIIGYLSVHVPSIRLTLIGFFVLSIVLSIACSFTVMDMVFEREQFFSSDLAESIQDKLNNMMNIVTNNDGDNAIDKNDELETKNQEMLENIMRTETFSIFFIQLLAIIAYAICTFIMYNDLVAGNMKVEHIITYMLILARYVTSMQNVNYGIMYMISYKLGMITAHKDFLNDIFKYSKMDTTTEKITSGNIHFKNISFKYEAEENDEATQDTYVFKDFNLKITDKEKVGIVGRSGSGKTTLMKILVGLHAIESGEVLINEQDVGTMNKRALRNHVNYINQRTHMFNGTVIHNLRYGNDKSEDEIIALLNKYNLTSIYDKLADGINSDVGVAGGQLSLGMQKVTMLVRGICRNTPVVVLDEPLAGLDTTTRSKILKMIVTECAQKTLIVITHDKEILPHMDRVVNLNQLQN